MSQSEILRRKLYRPIGAELLNGSGCMSSCHVPHLHSSSTGNIPQNRSTYTESDMSETSSPFIDDGQRAGEDSVAGSEGSQSRVPLTRMGSEAGGFSTDSSSDRIFPIRSAISEGLSPTASSTTSSKYHNPFSRLSKDSSPLFQQLTDPQSSGTPDALSSQGSSDSPIRMEPEREEMPYVTTRFGYKTTDEGHVVLTGIENLELKRCEDEPIHMPGAVQGFGVFIAIQETEDHNLIVRVASENSGEIMGYSPSKLFKLRTFTDILSDEQAENMMDHIEYMRIEHEETDLDPEVFSLHVIAPDSTEIRLWCAVHIHPQLKWIICEFELEQDRLYPLYPFDNEMDAPADTLSSNPSISEIEESTKSISKPLRTLKQSKRFQGEAAAIDVYKLTSQIQDQLSAAATFDQLLKILVGVVKDLTRFHRVMIYRFDQAWNGKVVTELVDPKVTKDFYKGLHFPASDIPQQARELYRVNKVRLLYDRELQTARLVCRTLEDLNTPIDMTHSYLRAMSPIHLQYLSNMEVRASMSISITAFDKLWGLISCHSYGKKGMRVSFPIRKMCRLVGEAASRNVERLSYVDKLEARKLINTIPQDYAPSGYIVASSEDLLKLFDADFGILSVNNETKVLGHLAASQEALALLEYLRLKRFTVVTSTHQVALDFQDLYYDPGFKDIGGFLVVPLSAQGADFIVFFRMWQLQQVNWAGNPYDKIGDDDRHLQPRKSFKLWVEMVKGKSREWTTEQVETALVLCLVYGKFIEVWRQKEAALQTSEMTRLLLANASHELRTPLNAIINFMEIALEGPLDQETRDNLSRSHYASKSLIHAINDLLDLTRAEKGQILTKEEKFSLKETVHAAMALFHADAERKGLVYTYIQGPEIPKVVVGDQNRTRQCISNLLSNAMKYTDEGEVLVELNVTTLEGQDKYQAEISVQDTGCGMESDQLDILFRQLEQVHVDEEFLADSWKENRRGSDAGASISAASENKVLGLGLAVVARIIHNVGGQLRLKSVPGEGSRFTLLIPFGISADESIPETPLVSPGILNATDYMMVHAHNQHFPHRKSSTESFRSSKNNPGEIDRLITAIQGPSTSNPNKQSMRAGDTIARRNSLPKRPTSLSLSTIPTPLSLPSPKFKGGPANKSPTREEPSIDTRILSDVTTPPQKVGEFIAEDKVLEKSNDENTIRPSIDSRTRISFQGHASSPYRPLAPLRKQSPANALSVLVAEDDPINSMIIKKRMERLGYKVHLTINGEQCANAFKENMDAYDVVLMDIQMPIMDGTIATAKIREIEAADPRDPRPNQPVNSPPPFDVSRIPIFAVSASLVEQSVDLYIDNGFDGWVMKPVDFKRLEEMMHGIVNLRIREKLRYTKGNWGKGGWLLKEKTT